MDRRLLGWLPTLAIFAIVLIALFVGAWKTALILLVPALVSMPVRWGIPYLHFLSSESMERGAMCLIVAVLGAVALGIETSPARSAADVAQKQVEKRQRDSGSAAPGGVPGAGGRAAAPVAPEVRAQTVKRAIANAKTCDTAHERAAGAVRKIGAGAVTAETRAAVATAVESCESSWILFNRPELRDDPASAKEAAAGMEACDEGYLGRWLANDNLLAAIDKGMPRQEIGRIERMNAANNSAVQTCSATMQKYGAHKS